MVNLNGFKEAIKRNWKSVLFLVVAFIIVMTFVVVLSEITKFLSSIATKNEPMLSALVEAEATILGFFGVIVVYVLTSFDNRIDRIEEQLFDLTERGMTMQTQEQFRRAVAKRKDNLALLYKQRSDLLSNAWGIGVCLVLSLLFSVSSFGGSQIPFSDLLSQLAIAFLFLGIGYIIWLFRKLGRRPE